MGPPSSPKKGTGSSSSGSRNGNSNGMCTLPALNSLWSVWYCTLAVAFQLYIVTASIKRFGKYIALPWPLHDQPYLELNAYVGFLGASVVLMPFFIATALLRVGNYPNDGTKVFARSSLVKKKSSESVVYQNVRRTSKEGRWARAIWRHGGPTAPFLHVASAFCLLLPRVFIEAQLIKHGFLKKVNLWNSELDFVVTHRDRLVSLPFLSTVNETELWAYELSQITSPPGTSLHQSQAHLEEESVSVSAEFLNFGISLLIYGIRYPSVFWDSSKAFGFLFSLQLLLNGLQQLIAFTGFGVLYKVQVYGPQNALLRFSPLMLDVTTTVLLFMIYNMAITATSCTLYGYGLQKHREWTERKLQRHQITWGKERWRLWGYTPHVSAFVVLVVLASTAAPIAYDFTLVYCGSLDGAVLAAVTSTVSHLFLWIVLWLFLTVKQRWKFDDESKKRKGSDGKVAKSSSCNGHISKGLSIQSRGEAPLLVIDNGQTYQIREKASRKAILNLAHRSVLRQKHASTADDEDIYWLKPRPPSPKEDPGDEEDDDSRPWLRGQRHKVTSPSSKHKVTFDEALSPTRRKSTSKSPKHSSGSKGKKQSVKFEEYSETASEEGDYATLTDIPNMEDCDEGHAHMSLCPLGGAEVATLERNDGLRSEAEDDLNYEDVVLMRTTRRPSLRMVDGGALSSPYLHPPDAAIIGGGSSKSSDSGASGISEMHPKHLMQKSSDSTSESSTSPEKGGGPGSDTSSGIHSGGGSSFGGPDKRSSSLENVSQDIVTPSWTSASLQRSIDPSSIYDHGDSTIMIFKKSLGVIPPPVMRQHLPVSSCGPQIGRATNMRMTSFSENSGYGTIGAPSAQDNTKLSKGHVVSSSGYAAGSSGQQVQPGQLYQTLPKQRDNYPPHC